MARRSDSLAGLDPAERELLREAPMPGPFEPTKAMLSEEPFSDPAWIFERKLDGVRALAFRDGDEARLFSRTQKTMRGYPEVVDGLEADKCRRFVVDGEVVGLVGNRTSFE